jgi:NAD(P)-dependent dehydrogenase (short-subunit alcohol dehydrogenase family)
MRYFPLSLLLAALVLLVGQARLADCLCRAPGTRPVLVIEVHPVHSDAVNSRPFDRQFAIHYRRTAPVITLTAQRQINLIAQNFVENPADFRPECVKTPEFKRLLMQVPAGRLASAREDALLALFLASSESDFFVGQAIPFSGGRAQ